MSDIHWVSAVGVEPYWPPRAVVESGPTKYPATTGKPHRASACHSRARVSATHGAGAASTEPPSSTQSRHEPSLKNAGIGARWSTTSGVGTTGSSTSSAGDRADGQAGAGVPGIPGRDPAHLLDAEGEQRPERGHRDRGRSGSAARCRAPAAASSSAHGPGMPVALPLTTTSSPSESQHETTTTAPRACTEHAAPQHDDDGRRARPAAGCRRRSSPRCGSSTPRRRPTGRRRCCGWPAPTAGRGRCRAGGWQMSP